MVGQGNLERTWEKLENLKINGYGRQSRKFIYSVQYGKGCTFSEIHVV